MLKLRPILLLASAASCSIESESLTPQEHVASQASPIVKGTPSDVAQDATVLVMHYDAVKEGGGAASGCTGSLLAPRLVLTARHCVAITDPGAACNAEGKPIAGGEVLADHEPSAIYVFGGRDRPDFIAGTARPARGKEILTTGAKTLCNADIALVLLDRPLEGARITPVRLDSPPVKAERVTVVGWGISDEQPNPPSRRQRADVEILDVGPVDDLGPTEFRIGEGTCQGDSGGPAIAASGAVLGALSRGGNGSTAIGADACLGGTNIFTSAAGHADFIRAGYEKAGQEPWIEGGPNPLLAKVGAACAGDEACQTNVCDSARKTCAQDCARAACPGGFVCTDQDQRRVCAPAPPEDEGCSVRPSRGSSECSTSTGVWTLFALAVFFVRGRRKK